MDTSKRLVNLTVLMGNIPRCTAKLNGITIILTDIHGIHNVAELVRFIIMGVVRGKEIKIKKYQGQAVNYFFNFIINAMCLLAK